MKVGDVVRAGPCEGVGRELTGTIIDIKANNWGGHNTIDVLWSSGEYEEYINEKWLRKLASEE